MNDESVLNDVQRLLHICLAEPPALQKARLEEMCVERPDLAAGLRQRFAVLDRVGFLADDAGVHSAAAVHGGPPAERATPTDVGGYRLIEWLGSGGMGVVYLAEQTEMGRLVALKLLRSDGLESDGARERFRREGRALSRLEHPAICPVYEVGESAGTPYIAMRRIEGTDLASLIDRARLGGATCLHLPGADSAALSTSRMRIAGMIETVARGVHAAHELRLVHRDLKPGNVMITPDGDPVVIDFGLVRDADSGGTRLTMTRDVVGSPAYMAPEQIDGADPIDRRTDVYGLGVILYECLTLDRPFEDASRDRLYRRILAGDYRLPRRRMPPDLAAVVSKAMDRDRRRRYGSALELAEDLRRVQAFEPIAARPAGPVLLARRWVRRHPVAGSVIAALGLGLIAVSVLVVLLQQSRTRFEVTALAASAVEVGEGKPKLAMSMALEAYGKAPGWRALSAIHRLLAQDHEWLRLHHGDPSSKEGIVHRARFSTDGTRLVTSTDDGTVRIWALDPERSDRLVAKFSHGGAIHSVEFAPKNRDQVLTTSMAQRDVRIWSSAGHELHRFSPPGEKVRMTFARFSPDGDKVLAQGLSGRAFLWTPESDEHIELVGHRDALFHGCFSPDGTLVATASGAHHQVRSQHRDYTVRIWRAGDGEPAAEPLVHDAEIRSVCFNRDSSRIATASLDGHVRLWSRDGTKLATFPHGGPVTSVAFSPDGQWVVSGSHDSTARIWHADRKFPPRELPHGAWVRDVGFSPDGQRIVTAGDEGIARIWSLDGRLLRELRGHTERIMCATFSPGGDLVATAGWDGARVWRATDPELPIRLGPVRGVTSLATFARGDGGAGHDVIAAGGAGGELHLWEPGVVTGPWPYRFPARLEGDPHRAPVCSLAFDAKGDSVIAASGDHRIAVFRCQPPPQTVAPFSVRGAAEDARRMCTLATLPDGRLLIGTQYGEVLLYDLAGRKSGPNHKVVEEDVRHVAVHPSGKYFAVATWGLAAVVLHSLDDSPIEPLEKAHTSRINQVAFSPDGALLASASDDNTARIWQLVGRGSPRVMRHEAAVTWVGFSPAGDVIATTSIDGTARLWTVDGEPIATLPVASRAVTCGAFSKDGKRLFTATLHGLISTWLVHGEDAVALARSRAVPLTKDEQRQVDAMLGR